MFLSVLALKHYALTENDLIAYVLGGAVLGATALTLICSLFLRLRLGKKLSAQARFDTAQALSKTEVAAGIILENCFLPPLFQLEVKRKFEHLGVRSPVHLLKGKNEAGKKRHLIDSIFFPHRGVWTLCSLRLTLADAFGLTRFDWNLPQGECVEVSAQTLPIKPLPVVAASSRAGDELSFSRERSGDLYDIKAYDPSDGISRILWKTYAKSRELVVRRPEPAIIPEGEVAVYLIAEQEDDFVAGALQSYAKQLLEQDIVVLFGTEQKAEAPAVTLAEIKKRINASVWNPDAGTGRGFEGFLESLQNANRAVYQVIVFASAAPGSWLTEVSKIASAHHIKLIVALVPEELELSSAQTQQKHKREKEQMQEFLNTVNRSGAELLQCEAMF